jgi:hypothetical protein
MTALKNMFSGSSARKATIASETEAQKKRNERAEFDVSDEERKAAERAKMMASNRDGRAATRLSDSILGGSAPLG